MGEAPPQAASRLKSGDRAIDPSTTEGELALMLVRLFRSLDPVIGRAFSVE